MDMMPDIEIYNEDAGALSVTLFPNLVKTKEQNKKNPALLRNYKSDNTIVIRKNSKRHS